MNTPKIKYSDKQIFTLLKSIHTGIITEMDLPEDLYLRIGEYLSKALYKGFGSTLETVSKADEAILSDLRDNVYLFSAAKTYQFTKSARNLLTDSDGNIKPFKQFYEEGKVIAGDYLDAWAKAEYNTVIGQSQMAQQWQSIEANKDVLPMLTFSTDGNACPECEPFEGLSAPVDDPIWDIACPLLHFNCACILIPSDDAEPSSKEFVDDLPTDDIPDDFQNNPGKTGEIFTKNNPYFEDTPKGVFGQLEIPNED